MFVEVEVSIFSFQYNNKRIARMNNIVFILVVVDVLTVDAVPEENFEWQSSFQYNNKVIARMNSVVVVIVVVVDVLTVDAAPEENFEWQSSE